MRPINFKEANVVYAAEQEEYLDLPVLKEDGPLGQVTSVWTLTAEERQAIANGKNIEVMMWTFNQPLQPLSVAVSERVERNGGCHGK